MNTREQLATIEVEDSGPGVDPAFRENIFKRFYEKSKGQISVIKNSGIGLAISREMAQMHGGELVLAESDATSITNSLGGAVFRLTLPLGRAHLKEQEVVGTNLRKIGLPAPATLPITAPPPPARTPTESSETAAAEDQSPRLLLVDDNKDILQYLTSVLADAYLLDTADDGEQGLAAARKTPPDAIISDVMMPGMDGLAFCHAVKTDLEISHIPVILLTAQTTETFRIEGLRTGADDYLTKPFNPTELRLRVRNILRARQQSQRRFVTTLALEPEEITITDTDEKFLRDAMAVVEKEMSNQDFKVEAFAMALAVSRSLLYTKLKALTGQTPNNFVKTIRLKRAAYLLKSGKMNVSQVAYEVGFKNPKYFRQCFKAQFDDVPSNYRKGAD